MKVYVITMQSYDHCWCLAVYNSKEKAEQRLEVEDIDPVLWSMYISEMEVQ